MSESPDKDYIQKLQNAEALNRKMFNDSARLMSAEYYNKKNPGTELHTLTKEVMSYVGGLRIELLRTGMWYLPLVSEHFFDNSNYELESKLFRHFFGNN